MNNKLNHIEGELINILHFLKNQRIEQTMVGIHNEFKSAIDLRSLQRRLKKLIESGEVETIGRGPATKYKFVKGGDENRISPATANLLPLSQQGKEIQLIVSQPQQYRHPVGYDRAFLESYRPNITNYLKTEEKNRLENLGITARINEPAGTYAKEILQRLLIDLAWNSSRLEGNTYSLLDTQRLIAEGILANEKSAAEAQMILNHKNAIEFIVRHTEDIGFNRYTILNLHALLSDNLLPNSAASGRLRSIGVGITQSVYTPPGMPQLIEEMFELMLSKASQIKNPFEQAFFIMVQLPYLQPFDDVNKRVSRLAANIPLSRRNLSPLSFTELPNDLYVQGLLGVYELNRIELLKDVFLWAYDRSAKQYAAQRQSLGDPDPFRQKYRETIRHLVTKILKDAIPKSTAIELIKISTLEIPKEDQSKFIEVIENELINLHEGNFARYMIRPAEFKAWQKVW